MIIIPADSRLVPTVNCTTASGTWERGNLIIVLAKIMRRTLVFTKGRSCDSTWNQLMAPGYLPTILSWMVRVLAPLFTRTVIGIHKGLIGQVWAEAGSCTVVNTDLSQMMK